MLDRLKRFRVPLAIAFAIFLVVMVIAELQLQVIRTAPSVDRETLMERPAIQMVVVPEHAPGFLHRVAEKRAERSIPRWLFDRFMAREMGLLLSEDGGDERILVHTYASLPHAASFVAKQASRREVQDRVSEITWTESGVHSPHNGLVVLNGSVAAEREALDAVFFQWGERRSPSPLAVTGDHFFEMVFDNRSGQAYLAMASLMSAFDFELDPNDTDITLSSFQFVITARIFVDVIEEDVFEVAMDFEMEPSARDRLGVINLRGGIDEAFSELGKRMERDHGVTISGESDWNENVIEFRYRIDSASGFLDGVRKKR